MKKILLTATALIALGGCTKTVYQTAPTTEPVTEDTQSVLAPKTTTTIAYIPPVEDYPPTNDEMFINGVYDLYQKPIYVDDATLLDTAYSFCFAMRGGMTAYEAGMMIAEAADYNPEMIDFLAAVDAAAVTYICPDQMYKWEAYANS